MGSMNKVILLGNLTRDVELKYTQSNRAVAQIGLALNHKYKTGEGVMKEETTFVDCEVWGATAENMSRYLSKGRQVMIEGRLKLDQWEDQGGQKRSKLKVVVENCVFVGSREGGDRGEQQTRAAAQSRPSQSRANDGYTPFDDESIPF